MKTRKQKLWFLLYIPPVARERPNFEKLRSPEKKERSAKHQSMTLLALIFKSSMHVIKIVKMKTRKQKLWFLLYIPPVARERPNFEKPERKHKFTTLGGGGRS